MTPLPPKSTDSIAEVYYRPPAPYMEPETLLAVMRKRLCAAAEGAEELRPEGERSKAAGAKPGAKIEGFASVAKPKGPVRSALRRPK